MTSLVSDVRDALRTLAKSRGFTAVAVATLALGIGANTAIFSVVRGVLWKSLPYGEIGQLVRIGHARAESSRVAASDRAQPGHVLVGGGAGEARRSHSWA